jgi:hypothetical protein
MQITTAELKDQLRNAIMKITFTKVDGSTRIMNATLQESYLPKTEAPGATKPAPDNLVRVWDLDKQDWRSVRVDRIQVVEM